MMKGIKKGLAGGSFATTFVGLGWQEMTKDWHFIFPLYFGLASILFWFSVREVLLDKEAFKRVLRRLWISYTLIPVLLSAPFIAWSARLHQPAIADPEDLRNKYVSVSAVSSIGPEGTFGLLFEFGVNHLNSEGGFFRVKLADRWSRIRMWQGPPDRTDIPTHYNREVSAEKYKSERDGGELGNDLHEVSYYFGYFPHPISPRNSEYLYIEASSKISVDREDIEYLAVYNSTLLPERMVKEKGQQFDFEER